jgi:hypothetical protein
VGAELTGSFEHVSERSIAFYDTPDEWLDARGFVLRRRQRRKRIEYTLKCRAADRYLAAAADVQARHGTRQDQKFEEDIAAPFLSRFSHSNTVRLPEEGIPDPLRTLKDAARLFPGIAPLLDSKKRKQARLHPVHSIKPVERVHTGPEFQLAGRPASTATIVWSNGMKGKILLVEFSFRYTARRERFRPEVVQQAKALFEALQQSPWADHDARTKTQFVFDGQTKG